MGCGTSSIDAVGDAAFIGGHYQRPGSPKLSPLLKPDTPESRSTCSNTSIRSETGINRSQASSFGDTIAAKIRRRTTEESCRSNSYHRHTIVAATSRQGSVGSGEATKPGCSYERQPLPLSSSSRFANLELSALDELVCIKLLDSCKVSDLKQSTMTSPLLNCSAELQSKCRTEAVGDGETAAHGNFLTSAENSAGAPHPVLTDAATPSHPTSAQPDSDREMYREKFPANQSDGSGNFLLHSHRWHNSIETSAVVDYSGHLKSRLTVSSPQLETVHVATTMMEKSMELEQQLASKLETDGSPLETGDGCTEKTQRQYKKLAAVEESPMTAPWTTKAQSPRATKSFAAGTGSCIALMKVRQEDPLLAMELRKSPTNVGGTQAVWRPSVAGMNTGTCRLLTEPSDSSSPYALLENALENYTIVGSHVRIGTRPRCEKRSGRDDCGMTTGGKGHWRPSDVFEHVTGAMEDDNDNCAELTVAAATPSVATTTSSNCAPVIRSGVRQANQPSSLPLLLQSNPLVETGSADHLVEFVSCDFSQPTSLQVEVVHDAHDGDETWRPATTVTAVATTQQPMSSFLSSETRVTCSSVAQLDIGCQRPCVHIPTLWNRHQCMGRNIAISIDIRGSAKHLQPIGSQQTCLLTDHDPFTPSRLGRVANRTTHVKPRPSCRIRGNTCCRRRRQSCRRRCCCSHCGQYVACLPKVSHQRCALVHNEDRFSTGNGCHQLLQVGGSGLPMYSQSVTTGDQEHTRDVTLNNDMGGSDRAEQQMDAVVCFGQRNNNSKNCYDSPVRPRTTRGGGYESDSSSSELTLSGSKTSVDFGTCCDSATATADDEVTVRHVGASPTNRKKHFAIENSSSENSIATSVGRLLPRDCPEPAGKHGGRYVYCAPYYHSRPGYWYWNQRWRCQTCWKYVLSWHKRLRQWKAFTRLRSANYRLVLTAVRNGWFRDTDTRSLCYDAPPRANSKKSKVQSSKQPSSDGFAISAERSFARQTHRSGGWYTSAEKYRRRITLTSRGHETTKDKAKIPVDTKTQGIAKVCSGRVNKHKHESSRRRRLPPAHCDLAMDDASLINRPVVPNDRKQSGGEGHFGKSENLLRSDGQEVTDSGRAVASPRILNQSPSPLPSTSCALMVDMVPRPTDHTETLVSTEDIRRAAGTPLAPGQCGERRSAHEGLPLFTTVANARGFRGPGELGSRLQSPNEVDAHAGNCAEATFGALLNKSLSIIGDQSPLNLADIGFASSKGHTAINCGGSSSQAQASQLEGRVGVNRIEANVLLTSHTISDETKTVGADTVVRISTCINENFCIALQSSEHCSDSATRLNTSDRLPSLSPQTIGSKTHVDGDKVKASAAAAMCTDMLTIRPQLNFGYSTGQSSVLDTVVSAPEEDKKRTAGSVKNSTTHAMSLGTQPQNTGGRNSPIINVSLPSESLADFTVDQGESSHGSPRSSELPAPTWLSKAMYHCKKTTHSWGILTEIHDENALGFGVCRLGPQQHNTSEIKQTDLDGLRPSSSSLPATLKNDLEVRAIAVSSFSSFRSKSASSYPSNATMEQNEDARSRSAESILSRQSDEVIDWPNAWGALGDTSGRSSRQSAASEYPDAGGASKKDPTTPEIIRTFESPRKRITAAASPIVDPLLCKSEAATDDPSTDICHDSAGTVPYAHDTEWQQHVPRNHFMKQGERDSSSGSHRGNKQHEHKNHEVCSTSKYLDEQLRPSETSVGGNISFSRDIGSIRPCDSTRVVVEGKTIVFAEDDKKAKRSPSTNYKEYVHDVEHCATPETRIDFCPAYVEEMSRNSYKLASTCTTDKSDVSAPIDCNSVSSSLQKGKNDALLPEEKCSNAPACHDVVEHSIKDISPNSETGTKTKYDHKNLQPSPQSEVQPLKCHASTSCDKPCIMLAAGGKEDMIQENFTIFKSLSLVDEHKELRDATAIKCSPNVIGPMNSTATVDHLLLQATSKVRLTIINLHPLQVTSARTLESLSIDKDEKCYLVTSKSIARDKSVNTTSHSVNSQATSPTSDRPRWSPCLGARVQTKLTSTTELASLHAQQCENTMTTEGTFNTDKTTSDIDKCASPPGDAVGPKSQPFAETLSSSPLINMTNNETALVIQTKTPKELKKPHAVTYFVSTRARAVSGETWPVQPADGPLAAIDGNITYPGDEIVDKENRTVKFCLENSNAEGQFFYKRTSSALLPVKVDELHHQAVSYIRPCLARAIAAVQEDAPKDASVVSSLTTMNQSCVIDATKDASRLHTDGASLTFENVLHVSANNKHSVENCQTKKGDFAQDTQHLTSRTLLELGKSPQKDDTNSFDKANLKSNVKDQRNAPLHVPQYSGFTQQQEKNTINEKCQTATEIRHCSEFSFEYDELQASATNDGTAHTPFQRTTNTGDINVFHSICAENVAFQSIAGNVCGENVTLQSIHKASENLHTNASGEVNKAATEDTLVHGALEIKRLPIDSPQCSHVSKSMFEHKSTDELHINSKPLEESLLAREPVFSSSLAREDNATSDQVLDNQNRARESREHENLNSELTAGGVSLTEAINIARERIAMPLNAKDTTVYSVVEEHLRCSSETGTFRIESLENVGPEGTGTALHHENAAEKPGCEISYYPRDWPITGVSRLISTLLSEESLSDIEIKGLSVESSKFDAMQFVSSVESNCRIKASMCVGVPERESSLDQPQGVASQKASATVCEISKHDKDAHNPLQHAHSRSACPCVDKNEHRQERENVLNSTNQHLLDCSRAHQLPESTILKNIKVLWTALNSQQNVSVDKDNCDKAIERTPKPCDNRKLDAKPASGEQSVLPNMHSNFAADHATVAAEKNCFSPGQPNYDISFPKRSSVTAAASPSINVQSTGKAYKSKWDSLSESSVASDDPQLSTTWPAEESSADNSLSIEDTFMVDYSSVSSATSCGGRTASSRGSPTSHGSRVSRSHHPEEHAGNEKCTKARNQNEAHREPSNHSPFAVDATRVANITMQKNGVCTASPDCNDVNAPANKAKHTRCMSPPGESKETTCPELSICPQASKRRSGGRAKEDPHDTVMSKNAQNIPTIATTNVNFLSEDFLVREPLLSRKGPLVTFQISNGNASISTSIGNYCQEGSLESVREPSFREATCDQQQPNVSPFTFIASASLNPPTIGLGFSPTADYALPTGCYISGPHGTSLCPDGSISGIKNDGNPIENGQIEASVRARQQAAESRDVSHEPSRGVSYALNGITAISEPDTAELGVTSAIGRTVPKLASQGTAEENETALQPGTVFEHTRDRGQNAEVVSVCRRDLNGQRQQALPPIERFKKLSQKPILSEISAAIDAFNILDDRPQARTASRQTESRQSCAESGHSRDCTRNPLPTCKTLAQRKSASRSSSQESGHSQRRCAALLGVSQKANSKATVPNHPALDSPSSPVMEDIGSLRLSATTNNLPATESHISSCGADQRPAGSNSRSGLSDASGKFCHSSVHRPITFAKTEGKQTPAENDWLLADCRRVRCCRLFEDTLCDYLEERMHHDKKMLRWISDNRCGCSQNDGAEALANDESMAVPTKRRPPTRTTRAGGQGTTGSSLERSRDGSEVRRPPRLAAAWMDDSIQALPPPPALPRPATPGLRRSKAVATTATAAASTTSSSYSTATEHYGAAARCMPLSVSSLAPACGAKPSSRPAPAAEIIDEDAETLENEPEICRLQVCATPPGTDSRAVSIEPVAPLSSRNFAPVPPPRRQSSLFRTAWPLAASAALRPTTYPEPFAGLARPFATGEVVRAPAPPQAPRHASPIWRPALRMGRGSSTASAAARATSVDYASRIKDDNDRRTSQDSAEMTTANGSSGSSFSIAYERASSELCSGGLPPLRDEECFGYAGSSQRRRRGELLQRSLSLSARGGSTAYTAEAPSSRL